MYSLAQPLFPIACQAFEDYQMNAVKFSQMEMNLIADLMASGRNLDAWIAENNGEKHVAKTYNLSLRELREFISKLNEPGKV